MRPLLVTMSTTWTIAPPPDQGLMAILLMALYGIQSEGELCTQIAGNEYFRWFLGISPDDRRLDAVSLAQMFSRLLRNSAAREFLEQTVAAAGAAGLLTDPHFAPDLQQITRWTSNGLQAGA
jgi:transposase